MQANKDRIIYLPFTLLFHLCLEHFLWSPSVKSDSSLFLLLTKFSLFHSTAESPEKVKDNNLKTAAKDVISFDKNKTKQK